MVVCKILLVSLAVMAMNARQAQSYSLVDSTIDCACFPKDKDSIRISKLADKYGKHERKVVYLFKHLDSQEITIYIPNEEKQLNFPDLTVNSGESYDIHKLPHLYYIFDNPSNMVTVGDHIHSIVTTNEKLENQQISKHPDHDDVAISQHSTVKPTSNEITTDYIGLDDGYIIIDNGDYQPSYVHPSTEDKKLPLTLPEHFVNIVPEHEEIVVDHPNQPEKHGEDTINNVAVEDHEHDDEKNHPSNVHPSTDDKKLPLTLHEHSVNLVPEYENIVVDHPNQPEKHGEDTINNVTAEDHEHDDVAISQHSTVKPTANEITTDSIGLDDGYIIIDNGDYQPSYGHPSTEDKKLPLTLHEHSVNLVPEYENIVVDHPNQPEKHGEDTINNVTAEDHEHDDEKNHPSNVHPSTDDNKLPLTLHEHSVNLVPEYENIVVDHPNQPEKHGEDTINVITGHDNEHDLQQKPTVNEITIDSTGLHDGPSGYVIIDNGEHKPNNVHPSTEEHEHTINSVTLIPGQENSVVDLLLPEKIYDLDTINAVTAHDHEHDDEKIHPNNIHSSTVDKKLPLTLHEHSVNLVPEYENIVVEHPNQPEKHVEGTINNVTAEDHEHDDEKNHPSNVHPSTEDKKLQLTLHEHSVNLVPEYENIVVDHPNQPEKHGEDTINVITGHDNEHDLQQKPTVNEITIDSTVLHDGPSGYVIIDNGEHKPSNVHPSTEEHEHTINSVTLIPGHDNSVVDLLLPQKIYDLDTINVVPEHNDEHDLQQKPTVNEITIDSTGLHDGPSGYVIIDNGEHKPSNVHPSTEEHEHTINSVTLIPGHDNSVVDLLLPQKIYDLDTINVVPEHDDEHDLQQKPTVNEITIDATGLHYGPSGYVIIDNGDYQPSNVHSNTEEHNEHSETSVPEYEKLVIDYLNHPEKHSLHGDINVIPGHDGKTPSNLNQNTKNSHGDGTVEIETINVEPNEVAPSPLVSTIPKHREYITSDNTVYSVQKLLTDIHNDVPPSTNLKLINNPIVDNWLIGEINNIRKSGTLLLSSVDIIEIKKHLLHILAENGLQFSEDGYLVDIRGHVLKITNLKLRTVLISDPVAYKKLIAGRKCVTPYEIPYLEAVFVSLAHPSKVLGLIPLRMSSLRGCKGVKCLGRKCIRKNKHVIGHRRPTKLNLAPQYKKTLHDGRTYSQVDKAANHALLESLHPLNLIGPSTGDIGADKTHKDEEDVEDGLGIRIIGGNPAVGSGTPVSSRGR